MSAKRKAAPNRAARRKAAKRSGARMKNARTVLVDRIAVPRDALLAMEDPTSVIMGMISEWMEDAENTLDADLFEETSIRFGRHPSPAFRGEVVIELQTVQRKTAMPVIAHPAPVDDEGNSLLFGGLRRSEGLKAKGPDGLPLYKHDGTPYEREAAEPLGPGEEDPLRDDPELGQPYMVRCSYVSTKTGETCTFVDALNAPDDPLPKHRHKYAS